MLSRNPLFSCLLLMLVLVSPVYAGESTALYEVIDGDSLKVVVKDEIVVVRLIGIDAPESGQSFGLEAKAFTLHFCLGKTLQLEYDRERMDRYGRTLAYIYADDEMLNEAIVRAGLALAYAYRPNTKYQLRLFQAQHKARAEGNGFWRQGGLEMTPSQWRKKHRR